MRQRQVSGRPSLWLQIVMFIAAGAACRAQAQEPEPADQGRAPVAAEAQAKAETLPKQLADKAAAAEPESFPHNFLQDFRGNWRPSPPWRLVGPDAVKVATPQPGGLRINLPAQRRLHEAVGVQLDTPIKGNVEISAGFEILHADKPTSGHGVGFELYVATDTPTREGLGLLRASRVNDGEVYLTSRITSRAGKREYRHSFTPTTSTSGQLRLTRAGRAAILSAADGAAEAFKELGRVDLGSEDLALVRLSAYTGHAPYAVDVLIKDLRVRTLGPLEVAAHAAAPRDAAAMTADRPRGRFVALLIIVLLVTLAAAGARLYARRRPRGDDAA